MGKLIYLLDSNILSEPLKATPQSARNRRHRPLSGKLRHRRDRMA